MKYVPLVLGAASVLDAGRLQQTRQPRPAPHAGHPQTHPRPRASLFDGKDLDPDKLRDKANHAATSLGKYLDKQDPKMRERFQRISDKVTAQLDKDKGRWREKLQAERQPTRPADRQAQGPARAGRQLDQGQTPLPTRRPRKEERPHRRKTLQAAIGRLGRLEEF